MNMILKIKTIIKQLIERLQIKKSKLFDCTWYLNNYPDVLVDRMDPIKHYVVFGWKEGRNPSPSFSTNGYLNVNQDVKRSCMNPLIHYIRYGKVEGRNLGMHCESKMKHFNEMINNCYVKDDLSKYKPTAAALIKEKKKQIRPIDFIEVNSHETRINLVTDSIGSASLLGGVGTALIIVTLLANKNDWTLRIHTRNDKNDAKAYRDFMKFQNIDLPKKVEFFNDFNFSNSTVYRLEVSNNDIFFASSWWSAYGIESCNLRKRFFGIIQEEETFFYPYCDERLWCESMMRAENIDFLINSKYLYDYFKYSGYSNIIKNGVCFEPAFPKYIYCPDNFTFKKKDKYKLFFYSRPYNYRNLFYTGLEMLDNALLSGILDFEEWEVVLAGADVFDFKFTCGLEPTILGRISWEDYAEFARSVDLSFSLMYTPHPSYPPYDMAASGAVVLTNKFANKQDMSGYSKNIILKELNLNDMLEGFKEAEMLAKDASTREKNYLDNHICRSWQDNLDECLQVITDKIGRDK
ncbi:hypothetical protein SDC9_80772 [bioreactor metagenome]|uniref:Glycosyl transferase family 1 domain-containing protein n=1 Tax=bioreactor metagenome TaxID=1076179 RepID=A0A644YZZ8_9ZZZZ